jgi:hypothetical protein
VHALPIHHSVVRTTRYIGHQTKELQERNKLLKVAFLACACALWCFEKVVKYLTRNAYIFIAITGEGFLQSAWCAACAALCCHLPSALQYGIFCSTLLLCTLLCSTLLLWVLCSALCSTLHCCTALCGMLFFLCIVALASLIHEQVTGRTVHKSSEPPHHITHPQHAVFLCVRGAGTRSLWSSRTHSGLLSSR